MAGQGTPAGPCLGQLHTHLINLIGLHWDVNMYLHAAECAAYYQYLISCSNAMPNID